jgi:hypothetical protein
LFGLVLYPAVAGLGWLLAGIATGVAHGALLWRQVRTLTAGRHAQSVALRVSSLLRVLGVALILTLAAPSGLSSVLLGLFGFLLARTWWLRRVAR